MEFATRPFHMKFTNPRLEKLTSRVICLSVCAGFLAIVGVVMSFAHGENVTDEFHVPDTATGEKKMSWASMTQQQKIASALVVLALALLVPCCGYCGAKNNSKPLICCFSCCNCVGGCLNLLAVVGLAAAMIGFGTMKSVCSPSSEDGKEACKDILKACTKFKSTEYALDTYEGCYDFMMGKAPLVQGILAFVIVLRCCSVCFECASCRYGYALYGEMDKGECINSADESGLSE